MAAARRLVVAWVIALLPAWAAAQPAAAAVSVRDDRGVLVQLPAPPRRIVSLLPSLTETVCAVGACARLVGTDRHSNHPQQVRTLPKLGGLDDAHVEQIVALKPDLVLLAMSSRIVERLESLGITVVALEPRSQADFHRVLQQVARLTGSATAEAVQRDIDQKIEQAMRQIDPAARGLDVYYEVGSGPFAASESSFVGELMARLGLRNIVPGRLGPYPQLNPEFVVAADPALIMIAAHEAGSLATRPGWARIRALREGRVCRFDAADGDVLARPGPRIGDAALLIARCVNRALAASPLPVAALPAPRP
ncbi:ABC transporter substrate-binding protein [Piscinibacter sakaiensis]|uniref:ABC transporter substrate-binding protein n=1 Tax=Piscinibacter sakaiensis TaxID=1547922 RepID=UPI003AAA587E